MVAAAAAAGLLVSSGLASLVGARNDGGGWGGGGAVAISSRRGIPFDTVIMVDAGSSGCRLNVYRVDGEVRAGVASLVCVILSWRMDVCVHTVR